MRRWGLRQLFLGIAVAVGMSAAAAADTGILDATTGEQDQPTPEVSTAQMRRFLSEGGVVLLDTRPTGEFVNGHIPGALHLEGSPDQAVAGVETLVSGDKAAPLVLYCNGPFCQASRRLAKQLLDAGFSNVRRYQLGMPVWRALGGPTEIEIEGVVRVHRDDRTALFLDARPAEDFAAGSLPGAVNLTAEAAAKVQAPPMPGDDFNTRIIVFGADAGEARTLADALSRRPWHNVLYFPGEFEALSSAIPSD